MSIVRDILADFVARQYYVENHFPFYKEDYDGYVDGTIDIMEEINGITEVSVIINFNSNIVGNDNNGEIIKKFETNELAKEFIDEFKKNLDSIPLVRFSEKFLYLNFDKVYTEFEEILV